MAGQLNDAVRVTARILPTGAVRREFGNTLFLDNGTTVVDARVAALRAAVRSYPDLASVSADGQPQSVIDAAAIYFQQEPYPKALLVGTVVAAVQDAFILGAKPGSVAAIEALGDNVGLTLGGEDLGGRP